MSLPWESRSPTRRVEAVVFLPGCRSAKDGREARGSANGHGPDLRMATSRRHGTSTPPTILCLPTREESGGLVRSFASARDDAAVVPSSPSPPARPTTCRGHFGRCRKADQQERSNRATKATPDLCFLRFSLSALFHRIYGPAVPEGRIVPATVGSFFRISSATSRRWTSISRGNENASRTRSPLMVAIRTVPMGFAGFPMTTSSPSRLVMTSIEGPPALTRTRKSGACVRSPTGLIVACIRQNPNRFPRIFGF